MNNAVSNNPVHHRYELKADGHIAATYYEIANGVNSQFAAAGRERVRSVPSI